MIGEYVRDQRWWLLADDEAHTGLFTLVRKMRRSQASRREMYRFYAELYGAQELGGLGLTNYDARYTRFSPATLPYNIVRSGVNTLLSRIAKNRPVPMILTERGNWGLSKRARGLTKYLEGEFHRLDVYKQTRGICRDALVFGTGILQVYADQESKRPALQRIFPWEILVEPADGRYGVPRSIYTYRWFDRTVLKSLFPKHAQAIEDASSDTGDIDDGGRLDDSSDVILVAEAWHLPSGPKAKDGKHVIAIDSCVLFAEKWTKPHFPFAFLRYSDPVIGFWGVGLGDELSGWQYEINYIAETLHLAHRAAAAGFWLVPDGADTVDAHFTDEAGILLKHKPGFAPTYVNPPPAHPQTYDYMERLRRWGMQDAGVSQMAIHGEKPPGIVANAALNTLEDQEDSRFSMFTLAWDELHCGKFGLADQLLEVQRELAEEHGEDIVVMVPNRKNYQPIKWADVNMDRDAYVMQAFPTGFLSKTPTTKLNQLTELTDKKIISDRGTFLKLLDAPDLEQETDVETAARQLVEDHVEDMLDAEDPQEPGVQKHPHAFVDLAWAVPYVTNQVDLSEMQGVPEGNRELLMNYLEELKALAEKDKAGAAAAMAPPPGMPGVPPPPMPGPMGPPGPPGMPPPGAPNPMPMPPPNGALS